MGIFDTLFGKGGEEASASKANSVPWIPLTEMKQLDGIVADSSKKTVAIFKHSTRCGISGMIIRQFEKEYALDAEKVDMYYLDLLSHRDVSNEIIHRFGVFHESPQLILIKNGKAVFDTSHGSISALEMSGHL